MIPAKILLIFIKTSLITSLPSVVIVNNKSMTKNANGELIELSFDVKSDGSASKSSFNTKNPLNNFYNVENSNYNNNKVIKIQEASIIVRNPQIVENPYESDKKSHKNKQQVGDEINNNENESLNKKIDKIVEKSNLKFQGWVGGGKNPTYVRNKFKYENPGSKLNEKIYENTEENSVQLSEKNSKNSNKNYQNKSKNPGEKNKLAQFQNLKNTKNQNLLKNDEKKSTLKIQENLKKLKNQIDLKNQIIKNSEIIKNEMNVEEVLNNLKNQLEGPKPLKSEIVKLKPINNKNKIQENSEILKISTNLKNKNNKIQNGVENNQKLTKITKKPIKQTLNVKKPLIKPINPTKSSFPLKKDTIQSEIEQPNLNFPDTLEKSNIFRPSSFITPSKFKGNLITKHNLTSNKFKKQPVKNSKFSFDFPQNTNFQKPETTKRPDFLETQLIFDDFSFANESFEEPEELSNFPFQNPVTLPSRPLESTNEKPSMSFLSTPSPTTIIPIIITQNQNKKKDKKNKTTVAPPVNIHDHIVNNLEYYQKLLAANCSKNDQNTIVVTPKPVKSQKPLNTQLVNDKDLEPNEKHKDCDCKHHHHGHHHGHKHSHESYKPGSGSIVVQTQPAAVPVPVYVHPQKAQTHIHHHAPTRLGTKRPLLGSADLPPLTEEYEEVGSMFDSFYRVIEGALSSKDTNHEDEDYESRDYSADDDEEEEESEDESDSDYSDAKKRRKRDLNARKSMTTKITVTNEFDDEKKDKVEKIIESNQVKVDRKKKKVDESEESGEIDEIFNEIVEGDYSDESEEVEGEKGQKGEFLQTPQNLIGSSHNLPQSKLPDYQIPSNHVDDSTELDYSNENPSDYEEDLDDQNLTSKTPSNFITRFFSSIANFFTSFFFDNEELSTQLTHKRPKRENSAWFDFLSDDDDEEEPTTTTISPFSFDENFPTTTSRSLDFFGVFSNFLSTGRRESGFDLNPDGPVRKKYTNYQLWKILPTSSDDVNYLEEFRMSKEGSKVHWLKPPIKNEFCDVVIGPEYLESFKDFLYEGEIKFGVRLRNIQHAIRFENLRLNKRQQIETEILNGHPLTFYHFHPSKDIFAFYGHLKRTYPNFVDLIPLGFSYQSKPLTIVKVSSLNKKVKKPGIFILSGTSGHLWLPIASTMHILNTLVTNVANNDTLGALIRKFDWYVLGLLNVDGYDFSMTYDRLWMKTRSQHSKASDGIFSTAFSWFQTPENATCLGVDLSKNFDYKWLKDDYNSGGDKCSDFYEGPSPKSEPEVKLLSNFLLKQNKTIKLFLNIDGFGSQISFPSAKIKKKSSEVLSDLAKAGLKNLKTHRGREIKYSVKKDEVLGSPESFAMHKAKIKMSFKIESMENRQSSIFVPATSIEENANNLMDIIKGMVMKI